jgi:hypothetical protein
MRTNASSESEGSSSYRCDGENFCEAQHHDLIKVLKLMSEIEI